MIDVRMSRLVDSETRNIKEICECRIIAISASVDGETLRWLKSLAQMPSLTKCTCMTDCCPRFWNCQAELPERAADEPLRILQEAESRH